MLKTRWNSTKKKLASHNHRVFSVFTEEKKILCWYAEKNSCTSQKIETMSQFKKIWKRTQCKVQGFNSMWSSSWCPSNHGTTTKGLDLLQTWSQTCQSCSSYKYITVYNAVVVLDECSCLLRSDSHWGFNSNLLYHLFSATPSSDMILKTANEAHL